MIYILIFILLLASELVYFRVAERFKIIDKPNERSSHNYITIRGGGIIYWVAALLLLLFNYSEQSLWFFVGITLISFVSFMDDLKGVKQGIRLFFHLLSMTCAFFLTGVFGHYSWWIVLIGYIIFIGVVNAYNFMDGINGMTGLYSISVLVILQYVNFKFDSYFVNPNMIWIPIIASVIFLFFNFRNKSRCFAGDIGSVSIAFWIVTLLLLLIIKTNNLIWLGFLLVYGVDVVCTILHRIYLKQNILEAHRLHFYQILVNERGLPHRMISLIYAVVQLIFSILIVSFYPVIGWWIFIILLVILLAIYLLKFRFMKTTIKVIDYKKS